MANEARDNPYDPYVIKSEEREKLYKWIKETFWILNPPKYTHEEWIKQILEHIKSG